MGQFMELRVEVFGRDPAAHQFHLAVATLAMFLAPLGVAGGEVALGTLIGVSLVRAGVLWRVWLEALRTPLAVAFALFVAWICLSLLWSPDPAHGIEQLQCMRALLWAPLLYPLLREPGARIALLAALLAGITVLALTQMWQFGQFHLGPGHSPQLVRFGGLHGEVGKAGMWSGAGVCIGAFLCVSPRLSRGMRIAAGIAMLCCLGGMCACATLRAMTGAAFGLVTAAAVCVALPAVGNRARRWWIVLPVAVALAGTWLGAERRWLDEAANHAGLPAQVSPVWAPASAASAPDAVAPDPAAAAQPAPTEAASTTPDQDRPWYLALDSLPPRILWWQASWHSFLQRPVIGRGWGATPTIVAEYPRGAEFVSRYPRVAEQHPELLSPSQPHSLYLMTLSEFGGIGAVLLAAIVALVARNCVCALHCCAELGGPAAATALWFVAAGGDTVFNTAVLAAGAVFMAFTAPLPRDVWAPAEVDISGGFARY
jgi:O-antigen ligase